MRSTFGSVARRSRCTPKTLRPPRASASEAASPKPEEAPRTSAQLRLPAIVGNPSIERGLIWLAMENAFRQRLERDAPIVLDAAMGTELSRRGANTAPPLWSARALVEAPELVETVHRENVAAGAEVLTIASFRLHARNIRESSCSLSQGELVARAVTLARKAASEISSKVNSDGRS